MFHSIYELLITALFGFGGTIPENLLPYAQQFAVNLSALLTSAIILLPFVVVIGMIAFIFRSFWR